MAEMHYDFETALKTLINAQSDVMTLVQKWGDMLSSKAQDVTFNLKGQGGEPVQYTIPNIQKIVETINTRTLPPDPSFNSVRLIARNGGGRLTAGSLSFAGAGKEMTYDADGIQGVAHELDDGSSTITEWPVPRFMFAKSGTQPSVLFRPTLPDKDVVHMSDFYIFVPDGVTVDLAFSSYGVISRTTLTGTGLSIFHGCMVAKYVYRAGLDCWARFEKMNEV
ncbi:MAG: hypothetical protein HUJ60_06420 [Bacilli bacterium]|nr:hypothetical protein [Bacilli bacterium]